MSYALPRTPSHPHLPRQLSYPYADPYSNHLGRQEPNQSTFRQKGLSESLLALRNLALGIIFGLLTVKIGIPITVGMATFSSTPLILIPGVCTGALLWATYKFALDCLRHAQLAVTRTDSPPSPPDLRLR